MAAELEREDRYYVVLAADHLLGYAGAFLSRPDADIQTVTVATGHRRLGMGKINAVGSPNGEDFKLMLALDDHMGNRQAGFQYR